MNFTRITILEGITGYYISLNSIHAHIPHVVVGTVKCIAPLFYSSNISQTIPKYSLTATSRHVSQEARKLINRMPNPSKSAFVFYGDFQRIKCALCLSGIERPAESIDRLS